MSERYSEHLGRRPPRDPERRRDGRRQRISDAIRQIKEEEERRETELNDKIEKRRQLEEIERAKGKKVRGRKPKFVKETRPITRNPTDVDSRRMISSVGYLQGYNAQIVVDCDSQVTLAEDVVQDRNDEQQLLPMLEKARRNIGRPPAKLLADSGYFCSKVVQSIRDVDLYVATPLTCDVRKGVPPRKKKRAPTFMEEMAAKLLTDEGHALFAMRSRTVECCFGNIKENRGMRRFLLRGMGKVRGEWTLACLGHNMFKLWNRRRSSWDSRGMVGGNGLRSASAAASC